MISQHTPTFFEQHGRALFVTAVVVGFVTMLLGRMLRRKEPKQTFWSGFLTAQFWAVVFTEVGRSILGTCLVAFFLHLFAERSFLRELQRQVLAGAALRNIISEQNADQIEEFIVRDPFVYENFKNSVTVNVPSGTHLPITRESCLDYQSAVVVTVKNVSVGREQFRWKVAASDIATSCGSAPVLEGLQIIRNDGVDSPPIDLKDARVYESAPSDPPEGQLLKVRGPSDRYFTWIYEIPIGGEQPVEIRYQMRGKVWGADRVLWMFTHPALLAEMTAHLPAGLLGFGRFNHPGAANQDWCQAEASHTSSWQFVKLKKGCLPYNGFEINWEPATSTEAPTQLRKEQRPQKGSKP